MCVSQWILLVTAASPPAFYSFIYCAFVAIEYFSDSSLGCSIKNLPPPPERLRIIKIYLNEFMVLFINACGVVWRVRAGGLFLHAVL